MLCHDAIYLSLCLVKQTEALIPLSNRLHQRYTATLKEDKIEILQNLFLLASNAFL